MATAATSKTHDVKAEDAYLKLRDIIMMPKNKVSMEILKIWYTDEDVKILTAGPFRAVQIDRYTIDEYSEHTGIPHETVKETFERLSHRGLLFWFDDYKDDHKRKYMIPPLFPGLVEYYLISPNNSIDERREFLRKFHNLQEMGFTIGADSGFSVFRVVPAANPGLDKRLIPVGKALEKEKSQILAYQDVRQIIKAAGKYENNIAILPCTCRTMAMMQKTAPDCKASVENCMTFGAPARFSVEEGIGKFVSEEECLEILERCEKEGLIHCTQNTTDKHGFICNCCTCCCGIFNTAIEQNLMGLFQKSDYVPVVDHDACSKCKKCIKYCKFNAVMYHMGEKEDKSQDRVLIREDVCIGCGVCASNCPTEAIYLKKVHDQQPAGSFVEAVMKMMNEQKQYNLASPVINA